MPAKNLKCTGCKERFPREQMISTPSGKFHSIQCASEHGQKKAQAARERKADKAKREAAKEQKSVRAANRVDKERIKKRTGKNGHYEALKTALHYYVKHVLRRGEPCYTCDKPQSPTDSGQAFHAGHFIPAGTVDPRRFMLENLRIQCYTCNSIHSGKRAEYRQRLIEEMGIEHVEWLECDANHPELKERYPTVDDIKKEAAYYRKLSRDAGR